MEVRSRFRLSSTVDNVNHDFRRRLSQKLIEQECACLTSSTKGSSTEVQPSGKLMLKVSQILHLRHYVLALAASATLWRVSYKTFVREHQAGRVNPYRYPSCSLCLRSSCATCRSTSSTRACHSSQRSPMPTTPFLTHHSKHRALLCRRVWTSSSICCWSCCSRSICGLRSANFALCSAEGI